MTLQEWESLIDARSKQKDLWSKACHWESIPEDSLFVVFDQENPFIERLSIATRKLQKLLNTQDKK